MKIKRATSGLEPPPDFSDLIPAVPTWPITGPPLTPAPWAAGPSLPYPRTVPGHYGSAGLNLMDRRTGRFSHYRSNPSEPGSLGDDHIYTIAEDQACLLWIGTMGGGLDCLDPQRQPYSFLHYRAAPPPEAHDTHSPPSSQYSKYSEYSDCSQYLGSSLVRVIHQDRQGNLWIGTEGGGLNRFHPRQNPTVFKQYRHLPDNPKSLSSDIIFSIHENRLGIPWIGTDGGGLDKFDPERNSFTHYNTSHGLPNNVVYGILEDYAGNLWLSTNHGFRGQANCAPRSSSTGYMAVW